MTTKVKLRFLILITILLILYFISNFIFNKYFDNMNLSKNQINEYIDLSDDISLNKCQINWKYIAVINSGLKLNLSYNEIESIFIIKSSQNKFRPITKDEIFEKLNLNYKKQKKFEKYLDELKFVGYNKKFLSTSSNQANFINSISDSAILNYNNFKILPSITIAQAILESGWGNSRLSRQANNLFGIKSTSDWKGEIISLETKENFDEIYKANFRKYISVDDSMIDHAKFLSENPRYAKNDVFSSPTYISQSYSLEKAGYSTNKDSNGNLIYAKLLQEIIKLYNLQIFDYEVQSKS